MYKKAYKYRLYPTKKQEKRLQEVLDRCRELYNAALQERRDAYRIAHVSIGFSQQSAQLPEIKEIRPEYADINAQVLQDTVRRVDKAFKAFFRRVKNGERPGYPRFRGYGRYDSFTFPQLGGFSLTKDDRVCLSKIGTIRIKMPKGKKANPPQGVMKTCTVKREGAHWYVIFTCEIEQTLIYHPSEEVVGIDLGLLHFGTLSDGSTIENPRYLRASEQKLKKLQRAFSQKKRGSKRRRKAAQVVGKNHRHIRNQRKDFHHKEARKLVNRYQTIVLEKLQPANMSKRPQPKQDEETGAYLPNGASAKAGLNKSIRDAGWSQFQKICESKAAWAGSRVLLVNPKYTSQMCSSCGTIVKKELSERWYSCSCGCELDRDHNAAINIKRAGIALLVKEAQARTEPSDDAHLRSL
jgi:putative transposase